MKRKPVPPGVYDGPTSIAEHRRLMGSGGMSAADLFSPHAIVGGESKGGVDSDQRAIEQLNRALGVRFIIDISPLRVSDSGVKRDSDSDDLPPLRSKGGVRGNSDL